MLEGSLWYYQVSWVVKKLSLGYLESIHLVLIVQEWKLLLDNREILSGSTRYESIHKQICTDNGMMHIMGILEYGNERRRHTSNEDK